MVGTGKFKARRGGGRHFSRDLVLDRNGVAESKSSRPENAEPQPTRDERREVKEKQAPKQGIDKDNKDANPNHVRKKFVVSDLGSRELTQEEREAMKEWEAKLKKTREERQAAQAKHKVEAKGAAGPSATAQPELTRAQRRELKKKQAEKEGIDKENKDADLINPSHVERKPTIPDLGSRELTQKEREAKEERETNLKKIREERQAAQAKHKVEAKGAVGPIATAQPELTRAKRRELKKKQAAQKQAEKEGIDKGNKSADPINPNHVEREPIIPDLGSRELTRKEREAKEAKDHCWERIKEEYEVAQAWRKAQAEGAAGPSAIAQLELTRAERRELKKKQAAQKQAQKQGIDKDDKDADFIKPNLNHVRKIFTISNLGEIELTRKEKEAKKKQEAKNRYWKLHCAGKTDEAKSDLARLKKIKEEREAAQAKRKVEAEAKAAEIEAKKKAALNGKWRV